MVKQPADFLLSLFGQLVLLYESKWGFVYVGYSYQQCLSFFISEEDLQYFENSGQNFCLEPLHGDDVDDVDQQV